MLTPSERDQAISFLVKYHRDTTYSGSHHIMELMLRNGHKGFASWTDHELLRGVQSIAKKSQSFEINNFISTIAAEKFILE